MQYPEAAEQFQAELENNPRQSLAMLYLADTYIQLNRDDEARPLLEKLAQENSGNAMMHRDLGTVDAEAGRNEDALREFEAAIALKPADPNTHWRLARLYRAMGRKADANAELEKTRTLNKAEDDRLLKIMSTIPEGGKSAAANDKKITDDKK